MIIQGKAFVMPTMRVSKLDLETQLYMIPSSCLERLPSSESFRYRWVLIREMFEILLLKPYRAASKQMHLLQLESDLIEMTDL